MLFLATAPSSCRRGGKEYQGGLHETLTKLNMEGGGRGARIIFFTFCSAFAALAVSMTIYYLRKHKGMKKKDTSDLSRGEREEKASISFAEEIELADVLKQNGHGEYTKATISSLLRLLERVNDLTLEKLLVILSNCSAFTRNQVKTCSKSRRRSDRVGCLWENGRSWGR